MATRWGIVGCGKISKDFCLALQTLDSNEHQIVAVAARDLNNAKLFAEDFKASKFYDSYEELACDPNVEICYIGTIIPNHVELCKMMMDNGKHVLCEKPLALNQRQVIDLSNHAKAKNRFFMEAMWARFNPTYVELDKTIRSGKIGKVLNAQCTFGVPIADVERVAKKKLGGGALLDIGIYCVHFSTVAFSNEKPQKITAVGSLNDDGVDITGSVILQYSGGRTATFTYSSLLLMQNEAVVAGTNGIMKLKSPFWCSETLVDAATDEVLFKLTPIELKTNFDNSYILRYEAQESRECILKGLTQSPRFSWDDSIQMHGIMDEVRRQIGVVYDVDLA